MTKTQNKLPIFVFLGSSIEYFDFLLFPLLASVLIQIFFPNYQNLIALNALFFSLGAFGKLAGGIIFGYLADKFGRKAIIQLLPFIMIVTTCLFTIMPTGLSVGFYAVVFCVLRLLQSLSFGAEMTTASIYAYESESAGKIKKIGLVFIGATLGAILATCFLSFINRYISDSSLKSFGWRIPFLIGTLLGAFSFLARKNIQETVSSKERLKLSKLIKDTLSLKSTLLLVLFVMLLPAALTSINLYFPLYFKNYHGIPLATVYQAQLVSLIGSGFFIFLATWIVDKFKIQVSTLYAFICLLFMIASLGFSTLFAHSIYAFLIVWQFFIAFTIVYGMREIIRSIPQAIRATVSGFIYNFSFLLGSFIPSLFSYMTSLNMGSKSLFYIPQAVAILGLISVFFVNQKKKTL
jgi:MFS family permease